MRSGRFFDLYVSETQEHLRLLTRSLLALERGEDAAIEQAFRAAHTIKGLAAAMGHGSAATLAHSLEDRLSGIRGGGGVDATLVDEMLGAADGLEAAIAESVRTGGAADTSGADDAGGNGGPTERAGAPVGGGAPGPAGGAVGPGSVVAQPSPADVPAGATQVLVIRLRDDAALPAARAELIRRAATGCEGVVGTWPAKGKRFDGELHVFMDATADAGAIEAAVRAPGDVAGVRLERWRRRSATTTQDRRVGDRRAPDTGSVRVDRKRLDDMAEGIAELSVLHARAAQSPDEVTSHRAAAVLASLQRMILELRMVPVSTALDRLARLVRDAAKSASREVDFEVAGGEIELDQAVLDALVDPLVHLLRNAVDHGIEPPAEREAAGKPRRGRIRIETFGERSGVRMVVTDDGRGVDLDAVVARGRELSLLADAEDAAEEDVLRLLFQPGFSTARSVTELSGRGVGLDVVAGRIRGLGGAIDVNTRPGEGTRFTLRVPLTLALSHSLRIDLGGEEYALPITHVTEVVQLGAVNEAVGETGTVMVRGEAVSLVDLGRVLGSGPGSPSAAVVAALGERRVALAVDRVIGHEQIVVKPFDAPVGILPVFSGATILTDGRPALLIDPLSVL